MVFIKNFENETDFNFKEIHITTESRRIIVTMDERRMFSMVEVYSAIKQWYLEDEKIIMFRFPITMLDMKTAVLNEGWSLQIVPYE